MISEPNLFSDTVLVGVKHLKVSELKTFDRKLHSIPTTFDERAIQFVSRAADADIADDVEAMFQRLRIAFGLKRKEISVLTPEPGWGVIQTLDFHYSIHAILDDKDPAWLNWERSVRDLNNPDLVASAEFANVFDNVFDRIEFKFEDELDLEMWIDKIEDTDDQRYKLDYDSALTHCVLNILGLSAQVHVTSSSCSIVHPKAVRTHEIFKTFIEARDAMSFGFASM